MSVSISVTSRTLGDVSVDIHRPSGRGVEFEKDAIARALEDAVAKIVKAYGLDEEATS